MNLKTKLFISALVLTVTAVLAGCKGNSNDSKEKNIGEITIITDGQTEYTLIRPDETTDILLDAAGNLRKAVNESCGDSVLPISTDWVGRKETIPTDTKEILFGLTNREESALAYNLLPNRPNNQNDYVITLIGDRIAFAGGSDSALLAASDYFSANYIKNGTVKIPKNLEYIYKHPYPELYIEDTELCNYTILYPDDRNHLYKTSAYKLNATIEKSVGYPLSVDTLSNSDKYENKIIIDYSLDNSLYGYTAIINSDGDFEIKGTPEAVEFAVSDYSILCSLFEKSFNLEADTEIASENYIKHVYSYKKEQSAIDYTPNIEYGRRAYAYHIIDDDRLKHWSGLMSSWDYDGRGITNKDKFQYFSYTANDTSTVEPVYLTRDITPQSEGIITFETHFTASDNAGAIELCNSKGQHAVYIKIVDKTFCILTPEGEMEKFAEINALDHYLKVISDFETDSVEIIYNGKNCGKFNFSEECEYVDMLRFGVNAEDTGSITPAQVKMYANYLVNERFIASAGTLNCDADIKYEGELCEVRNNAGMFNSNDDSKSLEVSATSFEYKKDFEKTSGKVIFEGKFILPKRADNLMFALTSDGERIAAIKTQSFGMFTGDNVLLRDYYSENVWQTVRIEADTAHQKAVMKINGKVVGDVYFEKETDYFDGISISYSGEKSAHFVIDELLCFADIEFEDYVPEPVISEDDDYIVGLNICSLWREGTHSGWDKVSAYDEIKPLLGYYDEGVPEVQDWEIKWMTEHGIDFQLFCWYATSPDVPMMHTHLNDALMNGYMNAKYSDKMKFALLWECANAARPQNSDDFRSNFIPYWIEHYLSDERYMTIDDKAVLAIFGADKLINDLGGTDKCKAEFDYFRDICEDLGYDGAIIMACSSAQDYGSLSWLKSAGFDAVFAYNWGKTGYNASYTESAITKQMNYNAIHVVPTLSTGFNNVGWAGTRSQNMTVDDYSYMLSTFKNTFLESYRNKEDKWKSEFIMLSTWNEYGEGTYIMPSGLNGFGYIDAVREHYGESDVLHEDIVPTPNQLSRFTQMYAPDRHTLEPLYKAEPEFNGEAHTSFDFTKASDRDKWEHQFGLTEYSENPEGIHGRSNTNDFAIKATDIEENNINLDDIACIKIKLKVDKDSTAAFFFTTEASPEWNAEKYVTTPVKASDDYVEYIFDTRSAKNWTGKLTGLRFDPMDNAGSFTVQSIKLCLDEPALLYLNSKSIENMYGYDMYGGKIYTSINPQSNILGRMGLAYRWSKDDGTLTLYNSKGSAKFTIGSNTAITNVVDVHGFDKPENEHGRYTLSKAVTSYDGLPVICINELADILGFEYTMPEGKYIDIVIE